MSDAVAIRFDDRDLPPGGGSSEDARDNEREAFCRVSGPEGSCTLRRVMIRPGLLLWFSDCIYDRKTVFHTEREQSFLSFSFMLSGTCVASDPSSEDASEFSCGQHGLFFFPDEGQTGWALAGQPFQCVTVQVDPELLSAYDEEGLQRLPAGLYRILKKNRKKSYQHTGPMTSAMRTALNQLVHCPYGGMARWLYLESRALELVACHLDQVSTQLKATASHGVLHPQDRLRTLQAREFLESRLDNPPDHLELARMAGMSHPKLSRCFKVMFGVTPFEFLRHERLECAKGLLEEGRNVTEAALSVGYSSLSHFSKAYRARFGISPGDHCRR